MHAMNSVYPILFNLISLIHIVFILSKEKIMTLVGWPSEQNQIVGHVTCWRNDKWTQNIRILEGGVHLGDQCLACVGGYTKAPLKHNVIRSGSIYLTIGNSGDSCAHDNELLVTIKAENFLISWLTNSFSRWTLLRGVRLSTCTAVLFNIKV
jgi:hypothetical protein